MKKELKRKRFYENIKSLILMVLFSCFCLLGGTQVRAQQQLIKVEGIVTDEKGEPFIGVNVLEEGTNNGIMTNTEGYYSISVPSTANLLFSFMGYMPQNIAVNNRTKIDVSLQTDTRYLDEVVVVGFSTQKKVNLTGSVGTIDSKSLESRPVMTASQALQGLVPGLNI